MKKLALTTALALAALAGPAAAKDHPDHGNQAKAQAEHGKSQQAKARKCTAHGGRLRRRGHARQRHADRESRRHLRAAR